jgi:hypothetical protein
MIGSRWFDGTVATFVSPQRLERCSILKFRFGLGPEYREQHLLCSEIRDQISQGNPARALDGYSLLARDHWTSHNPESQFS